MIHFVNLLIKTQHLGSVTGSARQRTVANLFYKNKKNTWSLLATSLAAAYILSIYTNTCICIYLLQKYNLIIYNITNKYIYIQYKIHVNSNYLSGAWIRVRVMVFNANFNNLLVISWRSVLLVEETGENHQPATSHWQTLSHKVVSRTPHLSGIRTHNVSGDRDWLHM